MFLPIGLQVDLILNRLRNKLALLQLEKERPDHENRNADKQNERDAEHREDKGPQREFAILA
jgi:hypothetical protein